MSPLTFLGVVAVIAVGFVVLDRWHQRRAWREAERWARAQMERRHGR